MRHVIDMQQNRSGFLPLCSCGWRPDRRLPHGKAEAAADKHLMDVPFLRLNSGSRPTAKTTARIYRENSENLVYTPEERQLWKSLADELEEVVKDKGPIEGQLNLFE